MRATARVLVFLIALTAVFPALGYGKLPPREEGFSYDEWADYTARLVAEYFPSEKWLAEKTITILPTSEVIAQVPEDDSGIEISVGFIYLLRNEAEYLVVLAHEIGHMKLKHRVPEFLHPAPPDVSSAIMQAVPLRGLMGADCAPKERLESSPDYETLERQELEADLFAVQALPKINVPCVSLGIMERFSGKSFRHWSVESPDERIGVKRYKTMLLSCVHDFSPARIGF